MTIDKKRVTVPGAPLAMRLILTRVLDEEGKLLAQWYLLSNVPQEWADAAHSCRIDGGGDCLAFDGR